MSFQILVSAVNKDFDSLINDMRLDSDGIIINQTNKVEYQEKNIKGHTLKCFDMNEKGVGLSRNNALMRASADIILFSDEDIKYDEGYELKVSKAFEDHPEADMLLFNMRVCEERRTYHIEKYSRVHVYNCGRYPTYSFAIRLGAVRKAGITFSLLFGGGAKYSAGEDSLFLMNCIKKGLKVYTIPQELGEEIPRPSTWFNGFNEKFFFDRGVLYHHLYGSLATLMGKRFVIKKKQVMCKEVNPKKAFELIKAGIKEAKDINKVL